MKITTVLQAFAVRFFVPSSPYGYVPEAIKSLKERYEFVGVPTTIEELIPPPNQGNLFRLGRFKYEGRDIIVRELHLYHLGAQVSTSLSTADSDLFLDDLMKWAEEEFKITFTEFSSRTYSSQLEFELEKPLPDYFPKQQVVGRSISEYVSDFWPVKPPFEVSSVTFSYDPATRVTGLGNFRIERRQGVEFGANLYFSEAPLTTESHTTLLQLFEDSLFQP
ncbi:MAG TPA: hypothetical protein VIX59_04345 [Candidatus Binataceae bacterium]